jgi:hypothetical protein
MPVEVPVVADILPQIANDEVIDHAAMIRRGFHVIAITYIELIAEAAYWLHKGFKALRLVHRRWGGLIKVLNLLLIIVSWLVMIDIQLPRLRSSVLKHVQTRSHEASMKRGGESFR